MEIKLELFEYKNVCMQMAELGAAAYEKKREPANDELKQREVYRWLKTLGYEKSILCKMEAKGLVNGYRKGSSKNSPIMYSKFEILSALNAIKMSKYINK